jgi:hypothetical protein
VKSTILLLTAIAVAGCGAEFQSVRMDVPMGAQVHINEGVDSPAIDFVTPFVGRFEIGSLATGGGIPLVFKLDEGAAHRYGGNGAIQIYGRLSIGKPTEFARTQTLRLAPSEDRISALVRGEVSEISAFVTDPNANRTLCIITMRMTPF